MEKEIKNKTEDATVAEEQVDTCGIRKGGIYSNIKMTKGTADAMVVVCGLLFIGLIVLMVVL